MNTFEVISRNPQIIKIKEDKQDYHNNIIKIQEIILYGFEILEDNDEFDKILIINKKYDNISGLKLDGSGDTIDKILNNNKTYLITTKLNKHIQLISSIIIIPYSIECLPMYNYGSSSRGTRETTLTISGYSNNVSITGYNRISNNFDNNKTLIHVDIHYDKINKKYTVIDKYSDIDKHSPFHNFSRLNNYFPINTITHNNITIINNIIPPKTLNEENEELINIKLENIKEIENLKDIKLKYEKEIEELKKRVDFLEHEC